MSTSLKLILVAFLGMWLGIIVADVFYRVPAVCLPLLAALAVSLFLVTRRILRAK
jgi:hypothetical protein